jgi:hypothetical protein
MRSAGSFTSIPETSLSSAGGVIGDTCEMGAGCDPMIDVINEAWLFPSKARVPVAIS